MTDYLTSAVDTFTLVTEPDLAHNGLDYLQVGNGRAYAYVWHPTADLPVGTTITAKLRLATSGAFSAPVTLSVLPLAADWQPSATTWNNAPTTTGTAIPLTKASGVDGDIWEFDVSAPIATAVGLGTGYGFRIEVTSAGPDLLLYSSRNPDFPPTLAVSYVVPPARPTGMWPTGNGVVATNKPCLTWVASDVAYVQVQVAQNATGDYTDSANVFDSGQVVAVVAEYDLMLSAIVPKAGVISPFWRCRYWDSAGNPSGWSDSAQYTIRAYPTVTLVLPDISGLVFDTEVPVSWTYSGATAQATARVLVGPDADHTEVAWDSGRVPTVANAITVPDGPIDDSSQQLLRLRVTDSYPRVEVRGFPTYTEVTQSFAMTGLSTVPPPDDLTVVQVGTSPFAQLAWSRGNTPDRWAIWRDHKVIARLDPATVPQDEDGNWVWIDMTASGRAVHQYRVAAVVGHKQSSRGPRVSFTSTPRGRWIGDPDRQNVVKLQDTDSGSMTMGEDASVYTPAGSGSAIRVVQGQRGYEGSLSGTLHDDELSSAHVKYNDLMRIRSSPSRQYVVAFPQLSFLAILGNIVAAPNALPYDVYDVSMDFWQQGDLLWLADVGVDGVSALVLTDDYEDGVDGSPVVVTSTRQAVAGAPVFRASAALHGSMGWHTPPAVGGGAVTYWLPSSVAGIVDVYLRVNSFPGTTPNWFLTMRPNADAILGGLQLGYGKGRYNLADQDGNRISTASSNVARYNTWAYARIVFAYTFDAVAQLLSMVATFYQNPADSPVATETIAASIPCTVAPTRVRIGPGTLGQDSDVDSVRLYRGNATIPPPVSPKAQGATHVYSCTGDPTANTVQVTSQVTEFIGQLKVGYSTTSTVDGFPISPAFSALVSPVYESYYQHQLSGLQAFTVYYLALYDSTGATVGTPFQTKTAWPLTPTGGTTSLVAKIGLVSCQSAGVTGDPQTAWADLAAWGPDFIVPQGDDAYKGATVDPGDPKYKKPRNGDPVYGHLDITSDQMIRVPKARSIYASVAQIGRTVSDHEICGNNDETAAQLSDTPNWPSTQANVIARRVSWAMKPSADTRTPPHGTWDYLDFGPRVRFIRTDFRNTDRTPGHVQDLMNGNKTMYGPQQMAWLLTQGTTASGATFATDRLNILSFESYWLADYAEPISVIQWDKMWNYPYDQQRIANFISSNGLKVAALCGDRHGLGYLSGPDNTRGGFPCFLASGMQQHNLYLFKNPDGKITEKYTSSWGWNQPGQPQGPVRQFGKVTLTWTKGPPETVKLDYSAWDSLSQSDKVVAPTTTWTFP